MTKKIWLSPIFWALAAALFVAVPQLGRSNFFGDDYVHIGVLEDVISYPGMGPLSLYEFVDGNPRHVSPLINAGPWPWFTPPYWKIKFFRPLPSALTALTHKLFGLNPLAYTLHNLLWYLLLLLVLGKLFQRILPPSNHIKNDFPQPIVFTALIVFAFTASHWSNIFYLATRWLVVTITFVLAGWLAHLKWREQGWKPGRFLSIFAFSLALLSGEAALAMFAYPAAYELFCSQEPLKKRINALQPFLILIFIYLLFYFVMGYGTGSDEAYINPFTHPAGFIAAFFTKIPAMIGELFTGKKALLWADPSQRFDIVIIGVLALIVCGLLLYPVWKDASPEQRRKVNAAIAGMMGSMIPLAAGFPRSHIIIIPNIGASVLISVIIYYWWRQLRKRVKPRAVLGGIACAALVYTHLIAAPYSWFNDSKSRQQIVDYIEKYHEQPALTKLRPHQKVVFLNCYHFGLVIFGNYYRKINRLPMPETWWLLADITHKHRYSRTANNKLELEIMERSMMSLMESSFKSRKTPLTQDETIQLPGLQITILQVEPSGPKRIEFKFEKSLDDREYCFLMWKNGRFNTIKPPAVGKSILLP